VSQPWWLLQQAQNRRGIWENPKIVYPDICKESRFTLDTEQIYADMKGFVIPSENYAHLGLLNSSVVWWFLRQICAVLGDPESGGRLQLKKQYVERIPLPKLVREDQAELERIVRRILEMKSLNDGAETLELENTIDEIVYRAYGMTSEEIALVDESNRG